MNERPAERDCTPECLKLLERLCDYVDAELVAGEAARVREHLERCARCRELAGSLREIRDLAWQMGAPQPAPGRLAEIAACVRRRLDVGPQGRPSRSDSAP